MVGLVRVCELGTIWGFNGKSINGCWRCRRLGAGKGPSVIVAARHKCACVCVCECLNLYRYVRQCIVCVALYMRQPKTMQQHFVCWHLRHTHTHTSILSVCVCLCVRILVLSWIWLTLRVICPSECVHKKCNKSGFCWPPNTFSLSLCVSVCVLVFRPTVCRKYGCCWATHTHTDMHIVAVH